MLIEQPVLNLSITSLYSLPYIFRLMCIFPHCSLSSSNYIVANMYHYDGYIKGWSCFSASGTSCLI